MNANSAVFEPHEWQANILLSSIKRKVALTGRQSGKTTLLKQIIYKESLEQCQQDILVCAPTHGAVKELLWRPFTRVDDPLFHPKLIRYRNNQDMVLELINGSRITFKGTENIDALLGRTIDLLILDEWQSHNPEVWTYLEPMLAAKNGTAMFTGTARKGNHITDFYEKGQRIPEWASWLITTENSGSPAGNPQALSLAMASMSEEEYLQEYCCIPMTGEGMVYPHFSEANITDLDEVRSVAALKNMPYHIGVDFNVGHMTALICLRDGPELFIVDEIVLKHGGANTYELAKRLKAYVGDKRCILYPDATGRNRSANTVDPENTNHAILRQHGFNLAFDHAGNPPIEDRTILVNSKIRSAAGAITMYVDPKCKTLINSFEKRQYHNGKPAKDNITDHATDCLDYVAWHLFNNRNGVIQRHMHQSKAGFGTLKGLITGNGTI